MNLIITAKMGNGTIQAKLEPLSQIDAIENIYFLRKSQGPKIPKVTYIELPTLCKISLFGLILTPLFLIYYTTKYRASHILSYHLIPYAFYAAISSLITRRPYFICQTGLHIQHKTGNKFLWFFLKKIIPHSKQLCVPGTSSFDFWISKGIPDSRISIVHSTIDTNKFKPGINNEKLYDFIYIGRIALEKRIDFLLKAFASVCSQLPQTKLLLVGDGPLLEQMKELTNSLNLNENVFFAGYHKNVLPCLLQSNFIVLTSDSEGLPCAIMEGMSAGLVPITSKVGNLTDIIINGETGFCFDKEDTKDLVQLMSNMMSAKSNEIEILRQKARGIIIEQHSHKSSIKKWRALLGVKPKEIE